MYFNRLFLILLLVFMVIFIFRIPSGARDSNLGMPDIQYYGTDTYRSGIQNYQITQDARGLIYVANNLGLLEYDGSEWRRYQSVMSTKIRSVHIDTTGNVFIGAQNEIGYFSPGPGGSYRYTSLNALIPDEHADYEDVWNIYRLDRQLVFATSKKLFFLNAQLDSLSVLAMPDASGFTFKNDGQLYAQFIDSGLKKWHAGQWHDLEYGQCFTRKEVTGLLPLNKDFNIVATRADGLFLIRNNAIHQWAGHLHNTFAQHRINTIYRLQDGSIAIGTNTDGLYILDPSGTLINHFNKDRGLRNSTIHSIFQDISGSIWLGLNNGMVKIDWNASFNFINENVGLPGTGYSSFSTGDYIYYGTNNGLYYTRLDDPRREVRKMEQIQGLVYNIQRIHGDILASCHFGLFQLKENRSIPISERVGWWTVVETDDPGKAIAGTYDGLFLLTKQSGVWKTLKKYEGFDESSRVMCFDRNNTLWMTHGYKGAYSFRFSDNYQTLEGFNYYGKEGGFPSNLLINVFDINQELIFPAESGIYTYNADQDKFEARHPFNQFIDHNNHVRYMVTDSYDNVYLITSQFTGRLNRDRWHQYELDTSIFNVIHTHLNDDLENITVLDDDNILFAAKDGFVHYQKQNQPVSIRPAHVLIRKITLTKTDSVLFMGNFNIDGRILNAQPEDQVLDLPYRHNSILIHYATPDFSRPPAEYRYMLEGYDEKWSEWSPNTHKEYTNLHEGKYTFKVMARNAYNLTSDIQAYTFTVLPPWYRSTLAYIAYVLLSAGSLFSLLYFYRSKYQIEKRRLIITQKRELLNKDHQLIAVSRKSREEIENLRSEKLRAEIKHKNRELATLTMHLIDKNHFINSIKSHINDLVKTDDKAIDTRKGLNRIVREINKNMHDDKDWQQFELYFDEVHGDFLKKIRNDFPNLTPQEIKLSAYLRMNMSTKEIANLLKISVRGVEIARYRLRKKLDIDRNTNLVDYMMNYQLN